MKNLQRNSLPPALRTTSLVRGRQGAPAPQQQNDKLKFDCGSIVTGQECRNINNLPVTNWLSALPTGKLKFV